MNNFQNLISQIKITNRN